MLKTVKLDKLARRLSRDLTANPKKGAVLGVMVLVALYFWLPMIAGWFSSGKSGRITAQTSDVILTDDPLEPEQMRRKPKEGLRWEKVRQWIDTDQLMKSAAFGEAWGNPFERSAPAVVTDEQQQQSESEQAVALAEASVEEITPDAVGLKVTSVMIGRSHSAALIAGDVYREQDLVQVTSGGSPIGFKIVRIGSDEVVVERNGKVFKLEFGRARLAKGDRIGLLSQPAEE